MSDDALKAIVDAAYKRVEGTVLAASGSAEFDQRLRTAIRKTLEEMRERIDHDPDWVDDVIHATDRTPKT
jgi:hypothetical protein